MNNELFTMIQWNIRGFKHNKNELTALIDKYKPKIILLQETFLTQETQIKLKNYIVLRKDRNSYGGGIIVALDRNICYTEINLNSSLEAIGINTEIQNRIYSIVNIYLPPNKNTSNQELELLKNKLEKDFIIAGDMNAHHNRWNSQYINNKGKTLDNFMEQNQLTVLNDTENTYYHPKKRNSNIDLTITNLNNFCKWNYKIHDDLSGSDHTPIIITHKMNKATTNRKFQQINYAIINEKLNKLQITENLDIESHNNIIIKTFQRALEKTKNTKQNNTKVKKYNLWWNAECKKAVKKRKKAFQKFKSNPTTKNWIEYKRLTASSKNTISTAKRESFKNFIQNLTHIPTSKELWNKIKTLQNNPVTPTKIMLKEQNQYITDNLEIANTLAKNYQEISSERSKTTKFSIYKTTQTNNYTQNIKLNIDNETYNKDLTMKELERALKNIKNTAPGEDNITYTMIERLDTENKSKILRLFNDIWTKGIMPQQWRNSIIIPILKNGKNKHDKNSYRPISLTSVLSKIMEKIIKERLMYKLEAESKVYNNQTGFKKNHSTYDSILRLESEIKGNLLENTFTVAVFLDIEKAYDTVWIDGLKAKLEKINIKGRLLKFLHNFLTNRTFNVKYKETFSEKKNMKYGLPQGTILSPHLFNIMTLDLVEKLKDKATMYADDLVIWESDKNINIAIDKLQTKINSTLEWMDENGFKISKTKTKYIIFTKNRKSKLHKDLFINGEIIEKVKQIKYLGLILDEKLNWNAHIEYVKKRCREKLNILRYISNKKWGADKSLILRIYQAVVRSIIDYGIFIYYDNTNNTNKLTLNRIQYEALRLATGNLKNTVVQVLEGVTGMLPLKYRAEKLACKFGIKRASIPQHQTGKEIKRHSHYTAENFNRYPLPVYGWVRKIIEEKLTELKNIENINYSYTFSNISCDTTLAKQSKKFLIKEKIQQEFLRKKYEYKLKNYKITATDGSKKEEGVGSGILYNKDKYKYKLPEHSTIYTAELFSIYKTISLTKDKGISKIVIITDSMSAIQGIKNNKQEHFLINKIYNMINESIDLVLLWVPSHMGIVENDIVDGLAQDSCQTGARVDLGLSIDEAINICNKKIFDKWKTEWQKSNYFSVETNPSLKKIDSKLNRRDQVVLYRLRSDNPRFKYKHFYSNEPPLKCKCGQLQKMEHVLVCNEYEQIRNELRAVYEISNAEQPNLGSLLNVDNFKSEFFNFLKKTNIYEHV